MKIQNRTRLVLRKETLRQLGTSELEAAHGGSILSGPSAGPRSCWNTQINDTAGNASREGVSCGTEIPHSTDTANQGPIILPPAPVDLPY
jgi:hypothetical protein